MLGDSVGAYGELLLGLLFADPLPLNRKGVNYSSYRGCLNFNQFLFIHHHWVLEGFRL